jgi:hypothetical protein
MGEGELGLCGLRVNEGGRLRHRAGCQNWHYRHENDA